MPQNPVQDAWTRYVQEGRNLREESRRQIETFVKRLVKEGELRAEQLQTTVDEIEKQSQKNITDLQKRIRGQLKEELGRIGIATRTDLDRLDKKVARLEKQIADQKKQIQQTKAAATATPKPAPRKPATPKTTAAKPAAAKPAAAKATSPAAKKPPTRRTAPKPAS